MVVTPDETDVVMVTRGNETARLECTPLCRPRPDIGDGEASKAVTTQITGPAAAARIRPAWSDTRRQIHSRCSSAALSTASTASA